MLHESQGIPPYATANALHAEEFGFRQTVRVISLRDILVDADVIYSHMIYKVKIENEHTLRHKARIASHGNEDSLKHHLRIYF